MSQVRPALTVDVNMGGAGARNIAGKIANQARASAVGPSSQIDQQQQQQQQELTQSPTSNGMTIRPGDVISEEDFMAQEGFSSDEEGQDSYPTDARGAKMNKGIKGARGANMVEVHNYEGQDGQVS
jgi:hypothetical protein